MKKNDPSKRKIHRSTTFWFSLIAIIINPIAWIMDYHFKMEILNLIIANKDKITPTEASAFIVNIPLATIATLAVMAISFYTLKRGADKVVGQLTEKNNNLITQLNPEDIKPDASNTNNNEEINLDK